MEGRRKKLESSGQNKNFHLKCCDLSTAMEKSLETSNSSPPLKVIYKWFSSIAHLSRDVKSLNNVPPSNKAFV